MTLPDAEDRTSRQLQANRGWHCITPFRQYAHHRNPPVVRAGAFIPNTEAAQTRRGIVMSEQKEPGYCEGDICGRDGCEGLIKDHPVEGCSCHFMPPCGACTAERAYCPDCGWEAADDPFIRQDIGSISLGAGFAFVEPMRRVLDPSKVDFVIKLHTASSMIKEGVYPPHMSRQEVEEKVRGTFGGRFNKFKDGFFEYVAYTD